jgi:G6PDH family F420-dependent oxidoreductase
MVELGYALSSEEFGPPDLMRWARRAEDAGFTFAYISDHFHPWIDAQGQSPFVWSVIGGIAATTDRIRIGTAVTCPTFRTHPAVIAHAAATAAAMLPGRFVLGLGSGEALNEHVVAPRWPEPRVRQDMLEEAVKVIRRLWSGDYVSHYGKYFTVENARIYTLPPEPPAIYLAAGGKASAEMAGRAGDGLIATSPDAALVRAFEESGGRGRPKVAQVTVCWAPDDASARETAFRVWPNALVPGSVKNEIPLPSHFEDLAKIADGNDIAGEIICGPDPRKHIESIEKYAEAGFEQVYVHQVGPDQDGFFDFYRREVMPHFSAALTSTATM